MEFSRKSGVQNPSATVMFPPWPYVALSGVEKEHHLAPARQAKTTTRNRQCQSDLGGLQVRKSLNTNRLCYNTAMNLELLESTALYLVSSGRGILAADESNASAQKRFDAVGVESTPENRRLYRQVLLATPEAKNALSGVIFYDETFWQKGDDGKFFRETVAEAGVLPGIKLDEGLVDLPGFPNEKVSKGLDTLPERLPKYRERTE